MYFIQLLLDHLLEHNESYQSYVVNMFDGKIFRDITMMAAVSRMWNLPCTFVSSMLWQTLQVHHEDDKPPIIIMGNGGDVKSCQPNTDFSTTEIKEGTRLLPRHNISDQEMMPKKYDNISKAESLATKWFQKFAKKTVLSEFDEIHCEMGKLQEEIEQSTK